MGDFHARTSAVSSVTIQREFQVDSTAGERLGFQSLLGRVGAADDGRTKRAFSNMDLRVEVRH